LAIFFTIPKSSDDYYQRADPAATGPPAGFLVRVRGVKPSLTRAERRVADAVLRDPGIAAGLTISDLAQAADVSEATVLRFCRSAGLGGYAELRLALAGEAARSESVGDRAVGSDIGPADGLPRVVEKIAFADARAIEETAQQLDVGNLERVVEALSSARRIEVYGIGASAFVAMDLQQKLHRIGRTAFTAPDPHIALTSAALLGERDVAIGISHTGATVDTIEPLVEARRQGALTVAVTNFPRSPIVDAADFVLTTAARETTFRSGAMSSRIAQLMVIDCIFVGVAQRSYAETRLALERTYEAVRHRRRRGAEEEL
jgi:DNA-binding MurR/RpiR family transcriptional regulator